MYMYASIYIYIYIYIYIFIPHIVGMQQELEKGEAPLDGLYICITCIRMYQYTFLRIYIRIYMQMPF